MACRAGIQEESQFDPTKIMHHLTRFIFVQLYVAAIIQLSFIGRTEAFLTRTPCRKYNVGHISLNKALVRIERLSEFNSLPSYIEGSSSSGHIISQKVDASARDIDEDNIIETTEPKEDEPFHQFNVVNDLVSVVNEVLPNSLDTTSSTYTSPDTSHLSM